MISPALLDAQHALELPDREMMSRWFSINIAVPIVIQNNINVQVCGRDCYNVQENYSAYTINIRY